MQDAFKAGARAFWYVSPDLDEQHAHRSRDKHQLHSRSYHSRILPISLARISTMPKEKNHNPVQEAKKAEKQKQLRKQKANLQIQRNEKLARRNPNRIQRDIDSLKELDQSGVIRPHERQRLQELEKDLAAVNKARAALGDKAPVFKPERRFDDDDRNSGGRGGRGGCGCPGGRGGFGGGSAARKLRGR